MSYIMPMRAHIYRMCIQMIFPLPKFFHTPRCRKQQKKTTKERKNRFLQLEVRTLFFRVFIEKKDCKQNSSTSHTTTAKSELVFESRERLLDRDKMHDAFESPIHTLKTGHHRCKRRLCSCSWDEQRRAHNVYMNAACLWIRAKHEKLDLFSLRFRTWTQPNDDKHTHE